MLKQPLTWNNMKHSLKSVQGFQLNIEDQSAVWRNLRRSSTGAVSELAWNDELTLAANFHSSDAHVPPFDNAASTQLEFESRSLDALIKHLSVFLQCSLVVHGHLEIRQLNRHCVLEVQHSITRSPFFASGPLPTLRSSTTSPPGSVCLEGFASIKTEDK